MFIYKLVPLYDHRTGKLIDHQKEEDQVICDYTGVECNKEFRSQNNLALDYINFEYDYASESSWYYDNIDELVCLLAGEDISELEEIEIIDTYGLRQLIAETPYFYGCSYLLVRDWVKNINKKKSIFFECSTIQEAARRQRIHLLTKFLKEKKYTIEQLGLDKYIKK